MSSFDPCEVRGWSANSRSKINPIGPQQVFVCLISARDMSLSRAIFTRLNGAAGLSEQHRVYIRD